MGFKCALRRGGWVVDWTVVVESALYTWLALKVGPLVKTAVELLPAEKEREIERDGMGTNQCLGPPKPPRKKHAPLAAAAVVLSDDQRRPPPGMACTGAISAPSSAAEAASRTAGRRIALLACLLARLLACFCVWGWVDGLVAS